MRLQLNPLDPNGLMPAVTNTTVNVGSSTGAAANGLPAGGTAAQILSKIDSTDYNAQWITNTAIQKGDGIYVLIRNNTGTTLTKGTIVYTNGATGAKVTVGRALATSDATSARTLGFVADDILNNDMGYVQIEGYLSGIDTQSLTDGSQLYLSGTVAGEYQTTKPVAPIHLVYVGVVAKAASAAGGGAIMVKCQNGYELDEIHDVLITSPTDGQVLTYENATHLWKNKTPTGGGTGITRSINSVSTNTSAGATALTDYVYIVTASSTLTLPTAVSNTNLYTIKNTSAGNISVATTSAQTIDGSSSPISVSSYQSLDLISDNSNWVIV